MNMLQNKYQRVSQQVSIFPDQAHILELHPSNLPTNHKQNNAYSMWK